VRYAIRARINYIAPFVYRKTLGPNAELAEKVSSNFPLGS